MEAYGEAFVSYTDLFYKDSVFGSVQFQDELDVYFFSLGIVGVIAVTLVGFGGWQKKKATQ